MNLIENIIPINYKIFFNINTKKLNYTGKIFIDINVTKNTNQIFINSKNICINYLLINNIKHDFIINRDHDDDIITINYNFVCGIYTLFFDIFNLINEELSGIYYVKKNNSLVICTQLEPNFARTVFPCFDYPHLKSTFETSIEIDHNYTCLSNMPLQKKNNNLFHFEKTPLMSTYLFCLIIGDIVPVFEKPLITDSNILVNGYCLKEHVNFMKWSVEQTLISIQYFEKWFNVKYSLPKLDIVSIPNFSSGAMENWGLITFREEYILLFDKFNLYNKNSILEVINHEIAHQWFGNLVTLKSWNNLWLNESFATYFAWDAIYSNYPNKYNKILYYLNEYYRTLTIDGLNHTHPIIPKKIKNINDLFDEISYSKGSCLINYIHGIIGSHNFKKGIRNYINDNLFSNTNSNDLFDHLNKFSDVNIKCLINDLINVKGYPFINIEVNENIIIKINKFNLDKNIIEIYPINIYIKLVEIKNNSKKIKLIKLDSNEVIIPYDKESLIYFNPNNELFCIINNNFNLPLKFMEFDEILKYISDEFIQSFYNFKEISSYLDLITYFINIENNNTLLLIFIIGSLNKLFTFIKLKNNNDLYNYLYNYINKNLKNKFFIILKNLLSKNNNSFIEEFINQILILLCINLNDSKIIKLSKKLFYKSLNLYLETKKFYLSKSLFKIIINSYPKYSLLIYDLINKNITPIYINDIIDSLQYLDLNNYNKIICNFNKNIKLQDYSLFFTSLSKNCILQKYVVDFIINNNHINNNKELFFKILKNIAQFTFDYNICELITNFIQKKKYENYIISINRIMDIIAINKNILN